MLFSEFGISDKWLGWWRFVDGKEDFSVGKVELVVFDLVFWLFWDWKKKQKKLKSI